MKTVLDRLCERCGVLPSYRDIWGRVHHTSDEAKRTLLRAMGVAADSDEAIVRSLDGFERRAWAQPLPPVQVVREAARPHRIPIALPASEAQAAWRWRLRRESGAEDSGESPGDARGGGARPAGRQGVRAQDAGAGSAAGARLPPLFPRAPRRHRAGGGIRSSSRPPPATCRRQFKARSGVGLRGQLYGLRSERNWGIGDFGDLRHMLEFCAGVGAGTVLLNPLHALFPDAPEHASPYSPSSRSFFNTLYLDVEAIADFAECAEARATVHLPQFQARLRALRAAAQVDYRGVAEVKKKVLECLYEHFRNSHLDRGSERARGFRTYQAAQGEGLRRQALFEALQEHFRAQDGAVWGWPAWPRPTATCRQRRSRRSAKRISSGWSFSNTCSGRRQGNSPRPARVRGNSGSASA
jgi:(1->4)-alpha-D-glucan 1-alpha-D-glucosylmutase